MSDSGPGAGAVGGGVVGDRAAGAGVGGGGVTGDGAAGDSPVGGGPIRVLLVDDDALVRAGLSMILGGVDDLRVVGEVADGAEVPAAVAAYAPDVVLMDIRMPRVDGLAATESLRQTPDPPEVLVLTTFDADEHVLRALRAGASGFLLKDTAPAEIVRAVRRVAAGEATLSPAVTRRLIAYATGPGEVRDGSGAGPAGARAGAGGRGADGSRGADGGRGADGSRRDRALRQLAGLSEREREVALALGRGCSNAEISAELFMSVATVKAYVSRLLAKLGLNNRVQVALLVHDAELV
ncbi:response regulator [Micromonospora sp. NPDC050397]|uniref:response regulator transcription factor n=1 Tax=Micromonospora sp. NPDC050397 TaxID=3364279 RepID=UPI00384B44CA